MENIANSLNVLLSDLNVFFRKLQNYHWYVEGKDFFTMHAKLEEYYNDIADQIDEVAEHILILGFEPLATMKDYLATAKLVEAENKKIKSEEVLTTIVTDFENLLQDAKSIKFKADNEHIVTTSTFMDDLVSDFAKKIWMIKQTLA